jgi:hypothetical protein
MKEYFSSDTIKVFFSIMKELLKITEPYGTQFRFIEGTRTHDANQLETLEIIFNQLICSDRIRFYQEVSEEEILDIKILYLPEEYVVDSMAYYKPYFEKHYDFIFGHGPTDVMWYMRKGTPEMDKHSAATVFKADELCKIANYSYFGHFHYNVAAGIDNRFKSIGTVSRWEFDKTGVCGFYYVTYDTTTKLAMEDYVKNEYAPILPTVAFSIKKDYDLEDLKSKLLSRINKVKDTADKTRLVVTIDPSLDSFIVMRDFVLASFGNIPNVKLLLKIMNVDKDEEQSELSMEEKESRLLEERPYLYDKSMQDEAKIAAFIKKKVGTNISLENILEVIQPKDNRIKSRKE